MKGLERNCTGCLNLRVCSYIHPYRGFYCPGMEPIINHHKARKEPLAGDLIGEGYDGFVDKDYKTVLIENAEGKESEHMRRHNQIMEMPDGSKNDIVRKAVAALAFFDLSISKIIRVLRLPERTFYRYYRGK